MPRSIRDIAWVAGFLEGEGYFGMNASGPRIYVNQTDLDTVEKLRDIMSPGKKIGFQDRTGNRQRIYRFWMYGNTAAGWMMTLYPFMSIRRRADIKEVIRIWSSEVAVKTNWKLANIIAKTKGITVKEAYKLTKGMMETKQ